MNHSPLSDTSPLRDDDLDTPEVRDAITDLVRARRPRTRAIWTTAAAAVTVPMLAFAAYTAIDSPGPTTTEPDRLALVAQHFDDAASYVTLPDGENFDALRAHVLNFAQESENPDLIDADFVSTLVTTFGECRWQRFDAAGGEAYLHLEVDEQYVVYLRVQDDEAYSTVLSFHPDADAVDLDELLDDLNILIEQVEALCIEDTE